MRLKNKTTFYFLILIFPVSLISIFYSLLTHNSYAASASMFLTPTTGSYAVGRTFTVDVKVNTGGSAINASEGKIGFDSQRISVVSISKAGSIFSLWTREPSFSNSEGTIEFGGGVPNPGFTGSAGTIIQIIFKAESPGDTTVNFFSGAVLANDGKGTNILSTLGGSTYSITPLSYIPQIQEPVQTAKGSPAAPIISSPTHPDSDLWYNKSTAEFEWGIPAGISAVRLLLGKITTAEPIVLYEPPISKKIIEDLEDGIWYFHARFRNASGWGQIAHFLFKIDTVPPRQFAIEVENGADPSNPSPLLKFSTTDETSGIMHYEISINGEIGLVVKSDEIKEGSYKLSTQAPGKHNIIVKAYDRAGNFTPAVVDVIIEPIEAPIITEYPERLNEGNQLILKGTSVPNAEITVYIKEDGSAPGNPGKTKTDEDGDWKYIHTKNLERGIYTVFAEAQDPRGAKSLQSQAVTISISPPLFLEFGEIAIDYITTMITLLILVATFVGILFYGWYRVINWRKGLRKEVKEAKDSVTNAFRALLEDTQEQFEMLEKVKAKRDLTREEKRILEKLKDNMKIAEKFISKEIKDVERKIDE